MSFDRVALVARVSRGAAAVACLSTLLLVVDHALAVSRIPSDASRVEQLQQQVTSDPTIAVPLEDERGRQTAASIARKTRARIAAWALLVSAALFVACGKWSSSRKPPRSPTLDEAVTIRLGLMMPSNGRSPRSARPASVPADDLVFVDELLARFGPSRESAIPILQAIQTHYRYLPDDALHRVCERTEITPAQIAGTSTFYAQFRRSPVGLYVVRVCHGTACHVAGADQITQELRRHLRVPSSADTDPEGRFTLDAVACVGCCSLAPVMMIEDDTAGHLTPASARQALDALAVEA